MSNIEQAKYLLPHREPMLMISDIMEMNQESIICCSHIQQNNPFLEEGMLPTYVGLELVAQASGLHLAMAQQDHALKTPKAGAIVAVRDMKLSDVKINSGASLKVCSTFLGGSQQAAMFEGSVFLGAQEVCTVKVTIAALEEG